MKPQRIDWDDYFMKIAQVTSLRSPDKTKVGAVVVSEDNRILSQGYNGLPRNIDESQLDWDNRELIRKVIIHAECNALLFINNISNKKAVKLYCTLSPCGECVKLIKTSGIDTVYFKEKYKNYEETAKIMKFFNMKLIQLT